MRTFGVKGAMFVMAAGLILVCLLAAPSLAKPGQHPVVTPVPKAATPAVKAATPAPQAATPAPRTTSLPIFQGSLASNTLPAGLKAAGNWNTPGPTTLNWTVQQESGGIWDYDYTLTVPSGNNISSIIVEGSPFLTAGDLTDVDGDFTGFTVNDFTSTGNPNLPGPIHGIQFTGVNKTTAQFGFETFKAPIWGNVYANGAAQTNTVSNAGFLNARPTNPAGNGSIDNHILIPDTTGPAPVPDASTALLAFAGGLPLLALRRRIFR